MNSNKNFLGQYIKTQRENMDKTIRELAEELGIRPVDLREIELGNKLPSEELLKRMRDKYGIDCDFCIEFLANRQEKAIKKQNPNQSVSKVCICYVRDKKPYSSR